MRSAGVEERRRDEPADDPAAWQERVPNRALGRVNGGVRLVFFHETSAPADDLE
ncbi:MAG: hypothetical protein IPM64_01855 [Phycisphaerales bacterium]|nr:hypothetical protein [Phycisphaerales bacterium]